MLLVVRPFVVFVVMGSLAKRSRCGSPSSGRADVPGGDQRISARAYAPQP
jgi:hypothetical protein